MQPQTSLQQFGDPDDLITWQQQILLHSLLKKYPGMGIPLGLVFQGSHVIPFQLHLPFTTTLFTSRPDTEGSLFVM